MSYFYMSFGNGRLVKTPRILINNGILSRIVLLRQAIKDSCYPYFVQFLVTASLLQFSVNVISVVKYLQITSDDLILCSALECSVLNTHA